jgi:hypothetical protein
MAVVAAGSCNELGHAAIGWNCEAVLFPSSSRAMAGNRTRLLHTLTSSDWGPVADRYRFSLIAALRPVFLHQPLYFSDLFETRTLDILAPHMAPQAIAIATTQGSDHSRNNLSLCKGRPQLCLESGGTTDCRLFTKRGIKTSPSMCGAGIARVLVHARFADFLTAQTEKTWTTIRDYYFAHSIRTSPCVHSPSRTIAPRINKM